MSRVGSPGLQGRVGGPVYLQKWCPSAPPLAGVVLGLDVFPALAHGAWPAGGHVPVLLGEIRLTGTRTFQPQQPVEREAGWNRVMLLPWGGAQVNIAQYSDYGDEDGWYRKLRLFCVGDSFFPRHLRGSRAWSINGPTSDQAMEAEEGVWLEGFDHAVRPGITSAVEEIRRRISLDFFDPDASRHPDGRLFVFEVTACMDAFGGRFGGAEPPALSACQSAVTEAFRKLLLTPDARNGAVVAGPAFDHH